MEAEPQIFEKALELLARCIGPIPDPITEAEKVVMASIKPRNKSLVVDRCLILAKSHLIGSNDAIDYLSRKCNEENMSIRQIAIKTISDFARLWPEHISALLELLFQSIRDDIPKIKVHALLQLVKITRLYQNKSDAFRNSVEAKMKDLETKASPKLTELVQNVVTSSPSDQAQQVQNENTNRNAQLEKFVIFQIAEIFSVSRSG